MMILLYIVFVVIVILVGLSISVMSDFGLFDRNPPKTLANPRVPFIIHLMYFPWNRQQQLLDNQDDFDHSYYHLLLQRFPDATIYMWTWDRVKELVTTHYPAVWETALMYAKRPTQLVDLYRWLVVYHFGGVYIQYDSILYCEYLEDLFPRQPWQLRLYVENVWWSPIIRAMPALWFPCRKGVPEEKYRIMNQIFAAVPRNELIYDIWSTILSRMIQMPAPTTDYEILFIGANAFVSEWWDKEQKVRYWYHKKNPIVEVMNFSQTKQLIAVSSKASWRTDPDYLASIAGATPLASETPLASASSRDLSSAIVQNAK